VVTPLRRARAKVGALTTFAALVSINPFARFDAAAPDDASQPLRNSKRPRGELQLEGVG